jgi:hypothetical protein
MEQRYEGTPQATIRVEGQRIIRTAVTNDWGLRLQWQIKRGGQVVATPNARVDLHHDLAGMAPGAYEIVLQMWKYINYNKNAAGEFTTSTFINVSNQVSLTI